MNAMAAVGVAQQAAAGPEIIVVNDGKPVEAVDTKSRAVTIGKYAAIVLIPLILGIAVGQMSKTAKAVNRTIDNAAVLAKDMNKIRTGLHDYILNPLLEARERGEGGNAFKMNDKKLTEALAENDKQMPTVDPETAFAAYMFDMDKNLVADILAFYSEAVQLRKDVQAHVQAAKQDEQLMEESAKMAVEAKPDAEVNSYMKSAFSRYGIIMEVPTRKEAEQGAQFGAKLVEIGPPICQDRKPSETGECQGPPMGFGYRTVGSGEGWDLMELGFPKDESVPSKKLLPLLPTGVFQGLIKGGKATAAEIAYTRRVNDLFQRADELVKLGASLEKALKAKANQSKSFTFFL